MPLGLPSVSQSRWRIRGNGRRKGNGRQRRGNPYVGQDW